MGCGSRRLAWYRGCPGLVQEGLKCVPGTSLSLAYYKKFGFRQFYQEGSIRPACFEGPGAGRSYVQSRALHFL